MPNNNKKEWRVACPDCKKERQVVRRYMWRIEKGKSSMKCFDCHRMKKGQTNKGSFKRGQHISPKTEFKVGMRGKESLKWKGEDVRYEGLHSWIRENWGKANKCENMKCKKISKTFHWAWINHNYKRNRNAWLMLCVRCHTKLDSNFQFNNLITN